MMMPHQYRADISGFERPALDDRQPGVRILCETLKNKLCQPQVVTSEWSPR